MEEVTHETIEEKTTPTDIKGLDTILDSIETNTQTNEVFPAPEKFCGKCNKTKDICNCGRPPKYGEEIIEKAKEYLASCIDIEEDKENGIRKKVRLPSIGGMAVALEVGRDTLHVWDKKYPEFSYIMERLRSIQEERLLNNGLSGDYAPTITKVILTKHGYREGIDNTTNDKDLPTPILGGITKNEDKE